MATPRAALLFLSAVPVLAAPAPADAARPLWIQSLPADPGRVYGLGLAALAGADAEALRQASDNGRADVIARLRANIKADTRISTTLTETKATGGPAQAARTQSAQVDTQVQARAEDLPGLVVQETWVDRPGRTCYALAYLDLGIATQELRTRLDTLKADLAGDRGVQGPRAGLVRVQALKKAHAGLVQLDDLAGLLGGAGGDGGLRADVLQARLDTERQLVAARSALTFGLKPAEGIEPDPDVASAVRTAVLKQGMGWAKNDPLFSITLRAKAGRSGVSLGKGGWVVHQKSPDFVVATGSLNLSLEDRAGEAYESMVINAKGVGMTEEQADALLQADYRNKLSKAVSNWLGEIGGW